MIPAHSYPLFLLEPDHHQLAFRKRPLKTAPVVAPPAAAQAPADALAPLIAKNGNLLLLWHFDPSSQHVAPHFGWFLYDPLPVFAAANSVTEIVGGEFYCINVRENQTAVLGGESRTLFGGWNSVSW